MKSPEIIFIPGFTMTFPVLKDQNFRCLVLYRVVNLPFEKKCKIKNFEEANFTDLSGSS